MASLKLSNANQSNQAVRPSFRARAAALKALAARVVRSEPASPPKPQPEPDFVDWHSPPPGFMAYPAIDPQAFVNIPEGLRLELQRLHDIADDEFERRAKAAEQGTHAALNTGFENRLRRQLRLDEIQAALSPERPVSAGTVAGGIVFYEDAAGNTRRAPVADWINFTAMRLYTVAGQEMSRQFNAGCRDLDADGNRALDAKLRRELRIEALFALAFRSHKVFAAAQIEWYGTTAEASSDPIHAAIEDVRQRLSVCAEAQRFSQPPGDIDPRPEQIVAREALHASLDVLSATVPATALGCAALARFAVDFHAAEDFAVDENVHGQQHLRILGLIARSPQAQGGSVVGAAAASDPIFAAMQAVRYAKLEHDRFEERVKGIVSDPTDREEERRLMDADSRALAAVYETTPTTRAGQLSLLHWIREQITNAGCLDGEPADGHESVWADGYRALEAALLAQPADRGNFAQRQADEIDLSGCSIRVLARLSERFTAAADMWSDMSCLPFAEADEVANRIIDEEYDRAGRVRDRIISLLRNHRPKDDGERDEILGARLRYEMDCEGKVQDQALLADITAAWRD